MLHVFAVVGLVEGHLGIGPVVKTRKYEVLGPMGIACSNTLPTIPFDVPFGGTCRGSMKTLLQKSRGGIHSSTAALLKYKEPDVLVMCLSTPKYPRVCQTTAHTLLVWFCKSSPCGLVSPRGSSPKPGSATSKAMDCYCTGIFSGFQTRLLVERLE